MFKYKDKSYVIYDVTVYTFFNGRRSLVKFMVKDRQGHIIKNRGSSDGAYALILHTEEPLNHRALHTRLKTAFKNSFLKVDVFNAGSYITETLKYINSKRGVYKLDNRSLVICPKISDPGIYFKSILLVTKIDFDTLIEVTDLTFIVVDRGVKSSLESQKSIRVDRNINQLQVLSLLKSNSMT